jgi:hypothetical protein
LHLLDRTVRLHVQRGERCGRLVREAEDFVMLTPRRPDREVAWLDRVMQRLGLTRHGAKTRVLDARRTDFVFLGHTHRWRFQRLVLDVAPQAQRRIRDELRRKPRRTALRLPALSAELNPSVRGARRSFCRVRCRTLDKFDRFGEERVARWWARTHARRQPAWSLVQRGALWRRHGLERW